MGRKWKKKVGGDGIRKGEERACGDEEAAGAEQRSSREWRVMWRRDTRLGNQVAYVGGAGCHAWSMGCD